ncbi:YheU family protein [uncultured Oceanicoccus sp.]|uniref:YheU family protein n=1 Tax=uncultured Oceanicoccus sp. TaxID=1706381 RepID=UPI0030DC94E7
MNDYIEIPVEQLSEDILQAVIEEFITREGTDYGLQDYTLDQKVVQIKRQLENNKAMIVYDTISETCTLLVKD